MSVCLLLIRNGYCNENKGCKQPCKKAFFILDEIKEIRREQHLTYDETVEYIRENNLVHSIINKRK